MVHMKIVFVVAQSRNHVIGKNNRMPWHLPADLQHFKKVTMGKPIVMGRKTAESIGRPLPGRRNIVISRQKNRVIEGYEVFSSIDQALQALRAEPEITIIGGANVYAQLLDRADYIYMTVIEADFDGDVFFPELNKTQWVLQSVEAHQPDKNNPYAYQFQIWQKRESFEKYETRV